MPVSIIFTSVDRAALQSIAKLETKIITLQQKLKGVGTAGKKAGKKTAEAFGPKAIASFKNFAAGLIGVGGVLAALRLISGEYRSQIELQKEAAGTQIDLAGAIRGLKINLFGASKEDVDSVLRDAKDISVETNVPRKIIVQALAQGISASSRTEADRPKVIAATRLAAQVLPHAEGQEIAEFAGALIDLTEITKTKNALANLAFVLTTGSASRVVDPGKQFRNIPVALKGATGFGLTPQEAAAFFSALSTSQVDVTGRRSGLATISFTRQLQEFFEGDPATTPGKGLRELIARNPFLDTPADRRRFRESLPLGFTERAEFLREHPTFAKKFIDVSSFPEKSKAPLRDFIGLLSETERRKFLQETPDSTGTEDSLIRRQFRQNLALFPEDINDLAVVAQAFLKSLREGTVEITAEAARIQAQGVEAGELAPTSIAGRRARAGAIRENLIKNLKLSGLPGFDASIRTFFRFDLPQGEPLEEVNRILRTRIKELLDIGDVNPDKFEPLPERAEEADRLLNIIEKNNELLEKIAANTAKTADKSGGTLGRVDDDPGAGARG